MKGCISGRIVEVSNHKVVVEVSSYMGWTGNKSVRINKENLKFSQKLIRQLENAAISNPNLIDEPFVDGLLFF